MHTFEGNSIARLRMEDYCQRNICSFAPHSHLRLHTCINYISFMLKEKKKKREISYSLICLTAWQLICLFWLFYYPLFLYLFHHCLSLWIHVWVLKASSVCLEVQSGWYIRNVNIKPSSFTTHTHLTGETHRHVAVSVSARQTDPGLC